VDGFKHPFWLANNQKIYAARMFGEIDIEIFSEEK